MQKLAMLIVLGSVAVLGLALSSSAASVLFAPLTQDPVPLGKFEATDEKENYANYLSSLLFEFKGLAAQGLLGDKGNVKHTFSRTTDDRNSSFLHEFGIDGTAYRFQLKFQLGNEVVSTFNGTSFKYKYWFENGNGLHADYNIPPENPMQIQHLYAFDQDGFVVVYKIGDVTARRWYKRVTGAATPSPPLPPTSATPKKA